MADSQEQIDQQALSAEFNQWLKSTTTAQIVPEKYVASLGITKDYIGAGGNLYSNQGAYEYQTGQKFVPAGQVQIGGTDQAPLYALIGSPADQLRQTVPEGGTTTLSPISQPGAVSGQPGQPYVDPNQAGVWTPPQTTNANNTVYKDAQGNVFMADGTPIDQKTFQEMGLNIAHINLKSQLDSRTGGQKEADQTFTDGGSFTGRTPGEQTDFFKDIKDRMTKADEMQSEILASMERSEEEKKLKKQVGDITGSFEAGLTDISGQTIPMSLITGQGAQLERQANDRLRALNRTLESFQDDREEKFKILSKAYEIGRNNVNDAIAFYNLTKPEKLAFDSETGIVYMQNPMTGEVYQTKVPGFQGNDKFVKDLMTKYPDAGILTTDTYSSAAQKLQNSKIYQQQTRLADTESTKADKTQEKEEKRDQEFNKALSSWDWTANANREQFIRQLRASYPEYKPSQISSAVYKIYPDGFNKLK